jgi:acetoacetate decarboxylase
MHLDDEAAIAGGREHWGFPKKHGRPKLEVAHEPLTGTPEYAGARVAVGSIGYKQQHLLYDVQGRKACSAASIVDRKFRRRSSRDLA